MATWSDWHPDILIHVDGCPSIIVDHELRRAAQRFFGGSRAWKVALNLIAVTAGQEMVAVSPDDTTQEMVRVEAAWYDGNPVDVYSPEEMDSLFNDDWQVHVGAPAAIVQLTPGTVRLYPIPLGASSIGLKLRVSVRPSEDSTGIPDELLVKYRDAISDGAKHKLMLYPNRPWTAPDLAALCGDAFETEIIKARVAASRSFGSGRISSRPRWC
jgi:hypothetical protein